MSRLHVALLPGSFLCESYKEIFLRKHSFLENINTSSFIKTFFNGSFTHNDLFLEAMNPEIILFKNNLESFIVCKRSFVQFIESVVWASLVVQR